MPSSEVPLLLSPPLFLLAGAEQPRGYCCVLMECSVPFTGFSCWRWVLRSVLTSFGFFLFFADLCPPVLVWMTDIPCRNTGAGPSGKDGT